MGVKCTSATRPSVEYVARFWRLDSMADYGGLELDCAVPGEHRPDHP
jgi:hypothetical protein